MNKKEEIKISDEVIRKYMNLKSITSEYNKKLVILEIKQEIINFIVDTY